MVMAMARREATKLADHCVAEAFVKGARLEVERPEPGTNAATLDGRLLGGENKPAPEAAAPKAVVDPESVDEKPAPHSRAVYSADQRAISPAQPERERLPISWADVSGIGIANTATHCREQGVEVRLSGDREFVWLVRHREGIAGRSDRPRAAVSPHGSGSSHHRVQAQAGAGELCDERHTRLQMNKKQAAPKRQFELDFQGIRVEFASEGAAPVIMPALVYTGVRV